MMVSNALEESMLKDTLSLLRGNNPTDISPSQGIMLIDGWLQALAGDSNLEQLQGQLNELRTALQAAQPDEPYVRDLVGSLADETQDVAEDANSEGTWTGRLESLSKILRRFASN